MKYRVNIDISFENKKDAVDLLNIIEKIKAKPWKPVGNETIRCNRSTRLEVCYHDEIPPKQCGPYYPIDFDKPVEVHKEVDIKETP